MEARFDGDQVAIRDSKNLHAAASELVLNVTGEQWVVFTAAVQT